MSKEPRTNTYTKIIDASLLLFNEHGERNISTNHISSHLNISPGNLYYHFANKDEIIVQIFKRYRQELLDYLGKTELPDGIEGTVAYMKGLYNILWDYRFLFSDVNALLNRSKTLLGEHNQFTQNQFAPLATKLFGMLRDKGLIHIDDRGVKDLTVNMWLVGKYWFDFDGSLNGRDSLRAEEVKARGVYRTLSLLRPHIEPNLVAEFDALMDRLVGDEAA